MEVVTVVVGYQINGRVWLGGDSALCWDMTTRLNDSRHKVVRKGHMIIGVAGDLKETNKLLRMQYPKCEGDPLEWGEEVLQPYVLKQLKNSKQWELLVGVNGYLIGLDCYGSQGYMDGYGAIGEGYRLALGAMHALRPYLIEPHEYIKSALKAASDHCTMVSPPYRIISTR